MLQQKQRLMKLDAVEDLLQSHLPSQHPSTEMIESANWLSEKRPLLAKRGSLA